jgi:hypothetical protein
MIALCRDKAAEEGFSPTLFVQPMHKLEPPRTYRTIFVCGGFGLGSTREEDEEALRRLYDSLDEGGTLVLDNENPYAMGRSWRYWQKEERAELPREWGPFEEVERKRASDGAEYALDARVIGFDPLEQRIEYEMRAGMWLNGELVREEQHQLQMTLYFKNELELMLEGAGFREIVVQGDHREQPATSDSDFVVFVARKP